MGLMILGLGAIVVAMGIGISTLAAFFMGIATIMVTAMSAFIAFLLVLI
jgi:hypothetical protein